MILNSNIQIHFTEYFQKSISHHIITNVNLMFCVCVLFQNDVLRYITSNNMHSEILNKPIR